MYNNLTKEILNKAFADLFNAKQREYVFYVYGSEETLDEINAEIALNKEVYDRITRKDSDS